MCLPYWPFQRKLVTENKMLNNSSMAFNIDGTLNELKDALFPAKNDTQVTAPPHR